MATSKVPIQPMAKTRALLTATEREQLAGEHGDRRKYQATSRARRRIHEELTTDVALLAEYHPDLLNELRKVVCTENSTDTERQVVDINRDHDGDRDAGEADSGNEQTGGESVNRDMVYEPDDTGDDLWRDEHQQDANTTEDDDQGGDTT